VAHAAPAAQGGPEGALGIIGRWTSEWGPVVLLHNLITDSQSVAVEGIWQQPGGTGGCPPARPAPGCLGIMEQATYDPTTRVFQLSYYEEWGDIRGTARLTLAPDGNTLSGTWTQPDYTGTWTMRRQPFSVAEFRQALAALPTTATASAPTTVPPGARASARCNPIRGGSGYVCNTSLTAPTNAAPGSTVAISRETLLGGAVQVERWTCSPAQPGAVLECDITTTGHIMQDGQVTVTFQLANGQQGVLRYAGRCDRPAESRSPCP
jgi:hypothetical protein